MVKAMNDLLYLVDGPVRSMSAEKLAQPAVWMVCGVSLSPTDASTLARSRGNLGSRAQLAPAADAARRLAQRLEEVAASDQLARIKAGLEQQRDKLKAGYFKTLAGLQEKLSDYETNSIAKNKVSVLRQKVSEISSLLEDLES